MRPDDDAAGRPRRRGPPQWMLRWQRARPVLLAAGTLLVLAALLPALGAERAGELRAALTFGWLGLLLMIASLWQPAGLGRHEAWVSDVRPPMDDAKEFAPYSVAECSCGWVGTAQATVEEAFADAGAHADVVDPRVDRPLG